MEITVAFAFLVCIYATRIVLDVRKWMRLVWAPLWTSSVPVFVWLIFDWRHMALLQTGILSALERGSIICLIFGVIPYSWYFAKVYANGERILD